MAYIPSSGSVVAFEGGSWSTSVTSGNASVITVQQSSIAVNIIAGSIAASFTPPANQSVSGTVGASIIGLPPVNVVGTPSISGTVNIGVQSGSVVAFQGTSPWVVNTGNASLISVIQGSVAVSVTPPVNQSVSGTVGASIIGLPPFVLGGSTNASVITVGGAGPTNQSVSGTVGSSIIGQLPAGSAAIGSIAALQGTNPWIMVGSVYGNVSGSIAGTYTNSNVASTVTGVAMMFKQNVSSSIMTEISPTFPLPVTISGTVSQSVSGTVGSSIVGQLPAGTAVLGSVAVLQGTSPWLIGSVYGNISGSVVAFQGTTPWTISSVYGNISGSVVAFQGAGWSGSVAAIIVGQPIAVTPNFSSVISINAGSVVTISQGSVITVSQNSSILANQAGTWRVSVAGSYASNSASIVSGLGLLTLGARNNGMASVLANADGSYGPFAAGAWGDQIVSIAPQPAWTSGTASCFTGVEQPIITSISGQYVNITGLQIANASANNVYMSFYGAGLGSVTGSIIGFTVAPANGGSNINFPIPLRTGVSSPFSASVSGVSSVYVSAQGFYTKA